MTETMRDVLIFHLILLIFQARDRESELARISLKHI